jgi:hypothetical protein
MRIAHGPRGSEHLAIGDVETLRYGGEPNVDAEFGVVGLQWLGFALAADHGLRQRWSVVRQIGFFADQGDGARVAELA